MVLPLRCFTVLHTHALAHVLEFRTLLRYVPLPARSQALLLVLAICLYRLLSLTTLMTTLLRPLTTLMPHDATGPSGFFCCIFLCPCACICPLLVYFATSYLALLYQIEVHDRYCASVGHPEILTEM